MKYYSAYGDTLQTTEDFDGLLARGAGPGTVHYVVSKGQTPVGGQPADAAYRSAEPGEDGAPRLLVWRDSNHYRIRRSGAGIYDVTPTLITCYPSADATPDISVIHFLGSAMSLRLEAAGIPTLHASAVVVNGRAVTFLSNSGWGKSTLAASLMQAGYPLLTDDVLPLERVDGTLVARPGYPQMRLWPAEALHFLGHYEDLKTVHPAESKRRVPVGPGGFGSFCSESKPLKCLYQLERRAPSDLSGEIEIAPIHPRDAMIELVRHSFLAPVVEALGWQPQRLNFFAYVVGQVPMRRLVYPSATEHLPAVRDAILADLTTL